jgi:hypothetical protein
MRFLQVRRTLRRGAVFVAVAALAVLGAYAGSARASTSVTITIKTLIADGSAVVGQIPTVTLGGKAGYELYVKNNGSSTVTQATITVRSDVGTLSLTGGVADYVVVGQSFGAGGGVTCSALAGSTNTLVCTPPGGKMAPGDSFTVDTRFTAPSSMPPSDTMTTRGEFTVAAQTVGGVNSQGTTIGSTDPNNALTTLTAGGGAFVNSYLLGNEQSATGHFGLGLPQTLLNTTFGIPASITDVSTVLAPFCTSCAPNHETVTIPPASNAADPSNPFWNLQTLLPNPYTWSMSATFTPPFKVQGVFYLADGASSAVQLPSCLTTSLAPGGQVLCVDSLVQNNGTKTITATGRGIENGNLGFG